MYHDKKILAIIPARGGSKGVLRKNIRDLNGKPLIAWTIEQVRESKLIDRCVVSTEDEEIRDVALGYGGDVPFLRPKELAADDTPGIDPILHAAGKIPGYDIIVLLQVTSPLRLSSDIDGAIQYCLDMNAPSCVSVTEAECSPYWMYTLDEQKVMNPVLEISKEKSYQRQKLPVVYQLNGAVYVAGVDYLQREKSFCGSGTVGYVMPRERSYDIDTMEDFLWVEFLMKNGNALHR